MTQQEYRGNLTAAEFPLLSELQGQTVIMPQLDQNFSRDASSPKNKDRDIGIPQIYYMHNMLPTDAGVTSVGYQVIAPAPAGTDNQFTDMFLLRDPNENVAYFVNTGSGRCYVLPSIGTGWLRTTDAAPLGVTDFVTVAYVNGETYIYFGRVGCYKYDFASNALVAVTLTGLTAANLIGITSSNGYMIAWTATLVLRSSIIDPTDFTPSLVTGAGGGGVQDIKGAITVCLAQSNGFVIYTKRNAVAAIYTGNVQYPFTYKENIGAGGLANPTLAAYDGNSTNHYVYSTSGLQEVSLQNARVLHAQVTDFIAGAQFEDFDEATFQFTQLALNGPMQKKIAVVANRYLVISYGVSSLTHALVYDAGLGRWGKLRIPHVDCFDYTYPSSAIVDAPKRSIGFLQADGTIQVAVSSYNTTGSSGVMIAGKYQLDRMHYLEMQEIHLDSVRVGNILTVKLLSSIDGSNTVVKPTALAVASGTYRRYNCRSTGRNHSVVFVGAFHANSLLLKFTATGAVR